MKREYYDEEMMLKEAITSQKTDQEIGMPDIEAELKRVKQGRRVMGNSLVNTNSKHISPNTQHLAWRRVAAIAIIVITISGLSWAFVYYQGHNAENNVTEKTVQLAVNNEQPSVSNIVLDTIVVCASEHLTLSYDKTSLEQIIIDLSTYYHLDKPVFDDQMAARKYMMHITFNPKGTVNDAIELLNNFGSVQISLVDNKLMVK